jgi:hypothetical protein
LKQQFEKIQQHAKNNYTPLMLPDISSPFEIYTDASRTGCGAVLLQRHEQTGDLRPVGFYSHLWHPPKAYAARDLEMFAIHKTLKHWRHLLGHGNPIQLYTDHHSLTAPVDPDASTTPAPLAHWLHHIGSYNIEFKYVKGSHNDLADALSRAAADMGPSP